MAVEVGIVRHRRQRIHETEHLRPQSRVPHRPPHQPFGPRRDPVRPRLGTAAELGDVSNELSYLGLRRSDTRALAVATTLWHLA